MCRCFVEELLFAGQVVIRSNFFAFFLLLLVIFLCLRVLPGFLLSFHVLLVSLLKHDAESSCLLLLCVYVYLFATLFCCLVVLV